MTRKTLTRSILLGFPLVALLLYVALNWYRLEEEEIWVGAERDAIVDPYLAYGRLLGRMGANVRVVEAPSELERLVPGTTLVLGSRRLAYMTPMRVRAIAAWIDSGGHAVIEREPRSIDDPLLAALGVKRVFPEVRPEDRFNPPGDRDYSRSTPTELYWPNAPKTLKVRLGGGGTQLADERERNARAIVRGNGTVGLDFRQGRGRVTVLPSLGFLRNEQVGSLDHALFGWLLASERESPTVALYLRMTSPPLGDWILREALPVALAAALLVLAWIARILPRFGPFAPEAPPVRRGLLEHIVASGRFLWSRKEGPYLLEALRERVWDAAKRRAVSRSTLAESAALEAVARLAGMPEARVRSALAGPAHTPAAFTEAVATLRDIEAQLGARPNSSSGRKRRP